MRSLREVAGAMRIALQAIVANKGRGALTTLGIIIGIVAVVLTMTIANGLQNTFRQSFSSVGADVVYVSRMPWVMMGDFMDFRNRPQIDLKQARALEDRLRGRGIVNPTMDTSRDVQYRSETISGLRIVGTTERQSMVSSAQPESGRFLTEFDVTYKKKVCVIGSEVRDGLFGAANPLNKMISIGRTKFRVVGVMEEQGGSAFGGPNFDRQVFLPITSYVKAYGGGRGRQGVDVAIKAPSKDALAALEFEIIGEMRKIRKLRPVEEDNFSINKLDTLVGAFNNVMGVVLLVGLLVTSVSLFVGGVGVMNIMFVSVTERTREIGIRKSIGAKTRSILYQFLFESASICLMGGLIGILLASILTAIVNKVLMPASISPIILVVAVAVSVAVGVLAGMVPAIRGSRLSPIEAIRHD